MKGSIKVESNFANITFYIVDNARYVYTDESHFYIKNPYNERWVFSGEKLMKNKENL